MHIVGTPRSTVVPVATISPSVSAGSNRGTTATAPPVASVAIRPGRLAEHVRERRGAEHDVLRPEGERLGGVAAAAPMLPWVRTAPLETPEVPEVKRITAGSAALRSTSGASPAARRRRRGDLRDPEPLGGRRDERRAIGVEHDRRRGDRAEPLLDLGAGGAGR